MNTQITFTDDQIKAYLAEAKENAINDYLDSIDWDNLNVSVDTPNENEFVASVAALFESVWYTATATDKNESVAVAKATQALRERIKLKIKVALGLIQDDPNPLQSSFVFMDS